MTSRNWVFGMLLAVCAAGRPAAETGAARPLGDLTGPWQLFVDDALVAERTGAVRTYHAFEKDPRNPVLVPDRPWEGKSAYLYGSVLPDERGRGYRMWYHASAGGYWNLYATSRDGIRWEKPALGRVEFQGSVENNILFHRTREDHMPQVVATPWERDPARRYKLFNYDYGRTAPKNLTSGFYAATSPDGVRWTDAAANPVLADPGDVGNFVWDPHTRRYVGYPKTFAPVRGYRRRAVGYSTTEDFERWPAAELVLAPDAYDDRWVAADRQHTDFYGLSGFAYESGYIGFLWIFRITDGRNDGPIFAELVSSRDGIEWTRQAAPRDPVLRLGKPGSWDDGMVFTVNQPMVEGDRVVLYYGGFDGTHSARGAHSAVGRATLRKDGFASLDAGSQAAVVTTVPLEGAQGALRVNVDAAGAGGGGAGWLRVEVLDAEGKTLPGYGRDDCDPVAGGGIDQAVTWGARRSLPGGATPIRLRFHFAQAALYGFRAGSKPVTPRIPPRPDLVPAIAERGGALELHGAVLEQEGGTAAVRFTAAGDAIELPGTAHLGRQFTLHARVRTASRHTTRLFSTHRGSGEPATGELLFDVNPNSGTLRLVVNGQRVQSHPRHFADGRTHDFAATYRDGAVRLYLDGAEVGEGAVRPGSAHLFHDGTLIEHFGPAGTRSFAGVHLAGDLRVGADQGGRFVTYQEEAFDRAAAQLVGRVEAVRVAWRAMEPDEIARLSAKAR